MVIAARQTNETSDAEAYFWLDSLLKRVLQGTKGLL